MNIMKFLNVVALVSIPWALALDASDFGGQDLIDRIRNKLQSLWHHEKGAVEKNWGGLCSTGKLQSPIDFKINETTEVLLSPLRFSGANQTPEITNITHSGDTVQVKLVTETPITVTGGVFNEKVYEFQQLHFHWGKNLHEGSEHTIAHKRFPLESHLVFYKANCTNITNEVDGMAVLGVHYETRWIGSNVLDPIIKAVRRIEEIGEYMLKEGGYPLRKYMPADIGSYFSYNGSLTTPPCTEGVSWIWFMDKMKVSDHQVDILHDITDELGHKVESNFRGTQPLNGREVYLVESS